VKAPERFQAKWKPVRVKKTRQIKNLEPLRFHRSGKGSNACEIVAAAERCYTTEHDREETLLAAAAEAVE
jgi:hypothetical protein